MNAKSYFSLLMIPCLFACNKQEPKKPVASAQTNAETILSRPSPSQGGPIINAKFIGSDVGCDATHPDNCVILWEPVIIRPKLVALMNEAISGGPIAVAKVFNSPEILGTDLPDRIGSILLHQLQSETYYLAMAAENDKFATYYAGSRLPLNETTQELIFQIEK